MPTFTNNSNTVTVAASELIKTALLKLAVQAPGEPLNAEDGATGLEELQRGIDSFNARREMIFNVSFTRYVMKANHTPHTIGPGGDFQATTRPVEIVGAAFLLNPNTPQEVDAPINLRDDDWYREVPLKSLTSVISTDLYYSPDQPLGNCYFYPICTLANPVRLELWGQLAQPIDLNTKLGFVQGYWDTIIHDLAFRLAPTYNRPISAELGEGFKRAMKVVQANNNEPPRISTRGGGLPSTRRTGRPDFNFLTGLKE
jgi:hypothetical protein